MPIWRCTQRIKCFTQRTSRHGQRPTCRHYYGLRTHRKYSTIWHVLLHRKPNRCGSHCRRARCTHPHALHSCDPSSVVSRVAHRSYQQLPSPKQQFKMHVRLGRCYFYYEPRAIYGASTLAKSPTLNQSVTIRQRHIVLLPHRIRYVTEL